MKTGYIFPKQPFLSRTVTTKIKLLLLQRRHQWTQKKFLMLQFLNIFWYIVEL